MDIRFGSNEYALVPGSDVNKGSNYIDIQILADDVSFEALEAVLEDENNLLDIQVIDEEYIRHFEGYTKLDSMQKRYNVVYNIRYEEVIIEPEHIDPETGEVIPAVIEIVPVEEKADIIYARLAQKDITEQVDQNTANIEFIAIMSDIEL